MFERQNQSKYDSQDPRSDDFAERIRSGCLLLTVASLLGGPGIIIGIAINASRNDDNFRPSPTVQTIEAEAQDSSRKKITETPIYIVHNATPTSITTPIT